MKSRGVGPHSRPYRLAALDGRTHAARLFADFRASLLEHLGPAPSVTQLALIERACWVHLRCCLMDAEIAAGTLSEQDSRQYLAWANTERRILGQLDLEPAATPQMTFTEYTAAIDARKAAAQQGEAAD